MIRKLDLEQRRTHCGARWRPELLRFRLDGPNRIRSRPCAAAGAERGRYHLRRVALPLVRAAPHLW
jgi:hypothetical protein